MSEWPFLPFSVPGWFLSSLSLIFRRSSRREVSKQDGQCPRRTSWLCFRSVSPSISARGKHRKPNVAHHPSRFLPPPGFFVVCNSVLCSVGVWNLSLVQTRTFYNGSCLSSTIVTPRSTSYDRSLPDHVDIHNIQHKSPPTLSSWERLVFCVFSLCESMSMPVYGYALEPDTPDPPRTPVGFLST